MRVPAGQWSSTTELQRLRGEVMRTAFSSNALPGENTTALPFSAAHLRDQSIPQSTAPICPNGPNGQLTTSGCVAASGTIATYTAVLSSSVSLTTSQTYYDGPSVSVPAGTFLIIATASVNDNNAAVDCKIWDGTTNIADAYANEGQGSITVSGVITESSAATLKLSCEANVGGYATMQSVANGDGGTPSKATQITVVKIG